MTTERKRKFIIDIIFVAIILLAAYFIIEYMAMWVLPFIIGLLVAIVLQRPVAYLTEHTRVSRGFWSVLLVLVVLLAIFALIGGVCWGLYSEAPGFAKWISGLAPDIKNTLQEVSTWFMAITDRLPASIGNAVQNAPSTIVDVIVNAVTTVVTTVATKVVTGGPSLLIATIFSIVASCYITKDYRKIVNFILCQLSDKRKELIINIKKLFVTNILKMLRGYIIIMFITYVELFIGLSILKVDYAAIVAAIIAVLDILPVLGTGTVLIPWFAISLLMGNVWMGVGVILLYIIITIVRNVIEPRIIGKQVGLPPIVTLIAMYVGLKIFGVFGMLLLPVTIIIVVKLQEGGIIHLWNTPSKTVAEDKPGLIETAKETMKKKFSRRKENK